MLQCTTILVAGLSAMSVLINRKKMPIIALQNAAAVKKTSKILSNFDRLLGKALFSILLLFYI